MQSSRDIKRRIRSVKNIAQITKAMEVVSMTKMRKAQQFALAARPYAIASMDMLRNILKFGKDVRLPLYMHSHKVGRAAIVVITTDKGLVGGFNDSVLHQAEKRMQQLQSENIHVDIVTVGRKAKEHFDRQGITSAMHLEGFGDYTEFEDTRPIAEAVLTAYKNKTWDAVYISYTHFRTTLKQENVEHQLLPASESSLENIIKDILPEYGRFSEETYHQQATASQYSYTYTFEPKPEKIISQLVENLLRISMHHIMLESNASEHSSRMVTMKNARDNAEELQEDLSLEFNKLRQASITAEISEIVAGAEALQ